MVVEVLKVPRPFLKGKAQVGWFLLRGVLMPATIIDEYKVFQNNDVGRYDLNVPKCTLVQSLPDPSLEQSG